MATWRQDLAHALRRFSKTPGLTSAVLLSIGLGIAANATVFSIVSRFVLRPAPVGDPGTLLSLHTTTRGERCCNEFSWPLFTDLRGQSRSFSGIAAYYELLPASIGGAGEPERVWGQAVSADFFDVARIRMEIGRGFARDEERIPAIVLSRALWERRFGAAPGIIGKPVNLSGRPFTVVGVAPASFHGIDLVLDSEFWVPLGNVEQLAANLPSRDSRFQHWLAVVGRLSPGVSRVQAAAELDVLAQRFARSYPDAEKNGAFRFETAGSLPPRDRSAILVFLAALTGAVLLLLGIACANVANLLFAQVTSRHREMAVRLALGATRGRLLRQMLTESVLLSVGGGIVGIALSLWATRALSAFRLPAPVPLDLRVGVDAKVVLATFLLSVGAGMLCGLAPAWAASRAALSGGLKGEDALARPGRFWTLRHVLVVSQIAMSLVLLCATGLFLRSLQNAAAIDVGFRSRGVVMMAVDPRVHGYTAERTARLLTRLRDRVVVLPGVASAAWTDIVPLSLGGRRDGFRVEGAPPRAGPDSSDRPVDLYMVTPGYFETMGISIVAGRDFSREGSSAPKVAVINQVLARLFFGDEPAIGRRVVGGGATYQIIGVVKNVKSRTLGEDLSPVLYRSLTQNLEGDPSLMGYSLLVRSVTAPAGVATSIRREIHALDPDLAVFHSETMDQHLGKALFLPRLAGTLFGVFGLAGLVLAAIGLYGVMSYSVSRRTREIGIRLALGAQRGGIQRLVVRQGMRLTVPAIGLGLVGALASAKVFASVLYGIRPHDRMTFVVVPLFLTAVALLACWIPSRRAARLDPLAALREE